MLFDYESHDLFAKLHVQILKKQLWQFNLSMCSMTSFCNTVGAKTEDKPSCDHLIGICQSIQCFSLWLRHNAWHTSTRSRRRPDSHGPPSPNPNQNPCSALLRKSQHLSKMHDELSKLVLSSTSSHKVSNWRMPEHINFQCPRVQDIDPGKFQESTENSRSDQMNAHWNHD